MLEAGVVGLNLEDTDHRGRDVLVAAEAHAERVAAVKQAGRAAGVDLVVNARVDVHLRQVGEPGSRLAEALLRARLYREAGADCVYPIGVDDEATIAALVSGAGGPVNMMFRRGTPSVARLGELGVARVTFGSGIMRAALAAVRDMAEGLRAGSADAIL
jgi:2-methylisocitrate lyase-like PEP mutase family enzyme